MLHYLINFVDRFVGRRDGRRLDRICRTGHYIEALESRAVLSAYTTLPSLDVDPVEFAIIRTEVSAVSPAPLHESEMVPDFRYAAEWNLGMHEQPPRAELHDLLGPAVRGLAAMSPHGTVQATSARGGPQLPPRHAPVALMIVRFSFDFSGVEAPVGDWSDGANRPPQMSQAPQSTNPQTPIGATVDPVYAQPPWRDATGPATGLVAEPVLPGLIDSYESRANSDTRSSSTSVSAHDAVFDRYATRDLLLMAGTNRENQLDNDDGIETIDPMKSDDSESDGLESGVDSIRFHDDLASILEVVERERDAVESVLALLRDVESTPARPRDGQQAAPSPVRDDSFGAEDEALTRDEQAASAVLSGNLQSGLVLLPATGDANQIHCDTTVMPLSAADAARVFGGIEPAVGIYRAFDTAAPAANSTDESVVPIRGAAASTGVGGPVRKEVAAKDVRSS